MGVFEQPWCGLDTSHVMKPTSTKTHLGEFVVHDGEAPTARGPLNSRVPVSGLSSILPSLDDGIRL